MSQKSDPNKKLEIIRAFRAAGFVLMPLKGKIPVHEGWREAKIDTYSEKELMEGNYAVVLPPDVVVVDFDPRNFKEGDNPVQHLTQAVGGSWPNTLRCKTGGGGLHLFYRKPADAKTRGKLKQFAGVDFKTEGGYVVGPGSIHPDTGNLYQIIGGTPDALAQSPAAMLELLKRSDKFSEMEGAGIGEYRDDEATRSRYIDWLERSAPPSVEGDGGDLNAFKVAAHGRDLALPPERVWHLMLEVWNPRCSPPWDDEDLKAKVIHAYKYASGALGSAHPAAAFKEPPTPPPAAVVPKQEAPGALASALPADGEDAAGVRWVLSSQGAPLKNLHNLVNYLRSDRAVSGIFAYNEFTAQIEFAAPAPWHRGVMPPSPGVGDEDLKLLRTHLAINCTFEKALSDIDDALLSVAKDRRYHPVRDYLNGLKWDGKPRLDTWLRDYLGVEDTAYSRAAARKTLCGAVMRVQAPGCKFDHVLVLEGDQDIGKSSVCAILGGPWSGDFPVDPNSRDTVQLLVGKWFVELAELESLDRAETNSLKAFVTRQTDKARFAYGRHAREYPRQCVFVGTYNPGPDGTYLKDGTGNRRFWPVKCAPPKGQVEFQKFKDARDQLFAEAMHAVCERGERLYMDTPELKAAAKAVVALRHAEHPWTERLGSWIESLKTRDFFTPREIFIDALGGIDKQLDRRIQVSIAQAMSALGWVPAVRRIGTRDVRGYEKGDAAKRAANVVPKKAEDLLGLEEDEPDGSELERHAALVGSGLL